MTLYKMNYFSPLNHVSTVELLLASCYSMAIFMVNIQMYDITLFHQFRPSQTCHSTYSRSNHPHSICIALVRKKFHPDIFFTRSITLWRGASQIIRMSLGSAVIIYPTYPHDMYFLILLFTTNSFTLSGSWSLCWVNNNIKKIKCKWGREVIRYGNTFILLVILL